MVNNLKAPTGGLTTKVARVTVQARAKRAEKEKVLKVEVARDPSRLETPTGYHKD